MSSGGPVARRVPEGMDDAAKQHNRLEFRQYMQEELTDLQAEMQKRLDRIGEHLTFCHQFIDTQDEKDPDYALYDAANSVLARGDSCVKQVEELRRGVTQNTVFFVDYSGSMSDAQLDRAYEIVRERMRKTPAHCGAIAFDTRPTEMIGMMPGPVAALHVRHPREVRSASGGGGTSAKAAVEYCDNPRLHGLTQSFSGMFSPVRKVLVSDGVMAPEDLALFDEVIVVPYEEVSSVSSGDPT